MFLDDVVRYTGRGSGGEAPLAAHDHVNEGGGLITSGCSGRRCRQAGRCLTDDLTVRGRRTVPVDLSAYARTKGELSLSYVSDPGTGGRGVFVDNVRLVVPGGEAAEGFETGLGPWTVPGVAGRQSGQRSGPGALT